MEWVWDKTHESSGSSVTLSFLLPVVRAFCLSLNYECSLYFMGDLRKIFLLFARFALSADFSASQLYCIIVQLVMILGWRVLGSSLSSFEDLLLRFHRNCLDSCLGSVPDSFRVTWEIFVWTYVHHNLWGTFQGCIGVLRFPCPQTGSCFQLIKIFN